MAASADTAHSPDAAPLGERLCAFALGQLRAASIALESEDAHEGVHQCRKAIRRARSVLVLARKVHEARGRRLSEDLGQLGRGLSRLRDAHVLVGVMRDLAADAPPDLASVLPTLRQLARERRDRLLDAALRRDDGFARRRARLDAMAKRLVRLDWHGVDSRVVADAVARCERRAHEAAKQAREHPKHDDAWHEWRRRVRRVRQLDSLLEELCPGLRPHHHGLHDLATALSEAQDAAVLLAACGRHSEFPPAVRALLRKHARERLAAMRRKFEQRGTG